MKSSDSKSPFRPFEELQALLEARSVQLKENDEVWLPEPAEPEIDPEADRQLYAAKKAGKNCVRPSVDFGRRPARGTERSEK